jgi:hypothetical protein
MGRGDRIFRHRNKETPVPGGELLGCLFPEIIENDPILTNRYAQESRQLQYHADTITERWPGSRQFIETLLVQVDQDPRCIEQARNALIHYAVDLTIYGLPLVQNNDSSQNPSELSL